MISAKTIARDFVEIIATFALFAVIVWAGSQFTVAGWLDALRTVGDLPVVQWLSERTTPIVAIGLLLILLGSIVGFVVRAFRVFRPKYSSSKSIGLALLKTAFVGVVIVCYAQLFVTFRHYLDGQIPTFLEAFQPYLPLVETLLFFVVTYEAGRWFDRRVLPTEETVSNSIGVIE